MQINNYSTVLVQSMTITVIANIDKLMILMITSSHQVLSQQWQCVLRIIIYYIRWLCTKYSIIVWKQIIYCKTMNINYYEIFKYWKYSLVCCTSHVVYIKGRCLWKKCILNICVTPLFSCAWFFWNCLAFAVAGSQQNVMKENCALCSLGTTSSIIYAG